MESIIPVFIHHDSIQRIKSANIRDYEQFDLSKITKAKVNKKFQPISKNLLLKVTFRPESLKIVLNLFWTNWQIITALKKGFFPAELKIANVSPIIKRNNNLDKENYRPVSVLPHLSKINERIPCKQVDNFNGLKFPPHLCDLRKNHNS